MSLAGKRVVVTGGGTGIGFGIAKALAAEGCHVIISGRRAEKLKEAVDLVPDLKIDFQACDVSDRDQAKALIDYANEKLGGIDVLVNSAGINIRDRTMAAMSPDDWDKVLAVNATGAYQTMYYALPGMRKQNDGLVINISSVAGKRAIKLGGVAYAASKFAMTALGTAVGNEESANGIRVTNIYPGEVNTPILEQRPEPVSDERKQAMLQPEDVASLVVTIASLPPRAHVAEMVIKPTTQEFV